uniref:Uncharacterized protein n=1 Tax=Tetranychus urticae TaxID=32264 RepID=T1JQ58_TETUR
MFGVTVLEKIEMDLNIDSGRIRTCNLLIRSQTPYPLGHRAILNKQGRNHRKINLESTIN